MDKPVESKNKKKTKQNRYITKTKPVFIYWTINDENLLSNYHFSIGLNERPNIKITTNETSNQDMWSSCM